MADKDIIEDSKTVHLTAEAAIKAVKAGDENVDIAAQIIADYADEMRDGWSAEEEKKLVRRVDWRLVPVLFVCATLSGLDKTAISAAAIYNLRQDLNLTGSQYSWVGSAPFFGGLVFMGPSAYCLQRLPSVPYFAFNVLCWGIAEMCMAACTNFTGLFICRFLLGGFEALLIPAVTLIVSMWYRPEEQPKRNSIILNVIAPILNGFVAWVCGYYRGPFETWKIIFLLLGSLTIVWAVVVYFFLPNNPLDAKWLSKREKYIIIQRKASDNTGVEAKAIKKDQILEAFLDIKTWLICTISGIILSFISATTRKYRTVLVAVSILLPLLGAVLCYALPRDNLAGQLIGLYILYTYWAPYVTLVSVYQANIAGHTKKNVLYAWFFTFRADQAPAYTGGTVAMIVCYGVAIAMITAYGLVCYRENRRREALDRPVGGQDWLDLTDKQNAGFRYTT
ncbi:major facilitator superfamily domain-containing protein [Aspergillus karnatakaensis]|uniref:major facilitator superfamily domain-containing protein n=1 Tax=Aspergillus karnatakaensis TaxID=1810916 RepID=UPI003CCCF2AD